MAGYTDIPPSYFDTLIARPGEILADTAVGVIEGGRKLEDKLAKARDIYNTTENYLDEGLARVGDLFDRSPPMMAGGPMSRAGYRHSPLVYEPYTEAEMGSSPYQETDTGPGLMMASGPMARKGYRHHPQGNAPPNAHFETEVNPNLDDDYDNLKAMTFHQNQMEPAGTPVKFTSKTFEQEMMDYNNGVPMTRQDFADYNDMRYSPKSDWQKWKESTQSGRR
jgi:hypothetical protein